MSHSAAEELTVDLTGPPATLLMPLWARAQEARRPDAILRDETAVRIVDSLAFDFQRFARKKVPTADYCLRASIIDALARQYVTQQPGASVIEFGAGLDTRFERLDNGRVRWFEVDLPEVIRLRRGFFAEGRRRQMIAASLVDDSWLDQIEKLHAGPALFVAEGVFYFLTSQQVRRLFERIAERFPGSTLIFDAQSPLYLRLSNWRHPLGTSRLTFALAGAGRQIEDWDPRFQIERYVGYGDSPYYDQARRRLSLWKRLGLSARIVTRHLFKIVQVGFRPR